MEKYLIPVVIVIAGMVIYHMFVSKALKLSAYEAQYDKI